MLIKLTNYCDMGCSHCLENSTVAGQHMAMTTFMRALDLTDRLEAHARALGWPPMTLFSGGECTSHPEIVTCIEAVWDRRWTVCLITNGAWLADDDLRQRILGHPRRTPTNLVIQVTNDARFYPRRVPHVDDAAIVYVDHLTVFVPLGRGKLDRAQGVPRRNGPASFNLRSMTRTLGDVGAAIAALRLRAVVGRAGNCSPSISADGTLVAGESNACAPIGTVDSTVAEVTARICNLGACNRCGGEAMLAPLYRRAIGLD